MPWLFRFKNSKVWWLGFRQNGRQILKSTGKRDRKEAERELAMVETMLAAQRSGRLSREVFEAITGRALPDVTLKAALAGWLSEAEGATSPATRAKYGKVASQLTEGLKADDRGPLLSDVTTEQLQSLLQIKRATSTASTTNLLRRCFAIFFGRCKKLGYIQDNPVEPIPLFKASRDEKQARRPFTHAELKTLHANAPTPFWKYMVVAGASTGLRLGDLATLPVAAVDWEKRCIRLVTRKTGKPVLIPLCAPLCDMLTQRHALNPKADLFWPEEAAEYEAHGAKGLSGKFYELVLVPAGLAVKRTHQKAKKGREAQRDQGVSFHCLRYSFISALAASGVNQQTVKGLVGHTSDQINDGYTKLPLEVLQTAVATLEDITR